MTMAAETKLKPTERPLLSGPPNNVYRVISGWVHFAMSTYYRIITVGGLENLPPDRGCIIAANHWNMAVDVGALIESCPRKVHFWTKAELFNGPPGVSRFMNAMGCLPVKRNSRSGKKESNEALFQSTVETLLKGGVIAIFPEGTSHHTPQLTELKDGASWAALQFAAAVSDPNDIAPIVPVGIIYEPNKSTWRSNVHVQYGKAVDVTPYLKEFAADPRAAVKRLTSALHAALETVTINAPNWETLHMAKDAQYIALGKGRAQSDVQVISRLIKAVSTDKPEAAQLKSQVEKYESTLKSLSIRDTDIVHGRIPGAGALFVQLVVFLSWALLALALIAPSYIVHFPAGLLIKRFNAKEKNLESRAQVQIFFGHAIILADYTAWYFLLTRLTGAEAWDASMACWGLVALLGWFYVHLEDFRSDSATAVSRTWRLLCAKVTKGSERLEEAVKQRKEVVRVLLEAAGTESKKVA